MDEEVLFGADVLQELSKTRKAERAERVAIIDQEAAGFGALDADFRRTRPVDETSLVSLAAVPIGRGIDERLQPHQRLGVEFLRRVHHRGCGGCILADDMGLGKTVQTSTFLGDLGRRGLARRVLLVVPTSMLDDWRTALAQDWGLLQPSNVVMYTGGVAQRRKQWLAFSGAGPPQLATSSPSSTVSSANPMSILLTTAGVLQHDIDTMAGFRFDYAVIDEAHVLKNPSTKTHKAAVRVSALHRIAITGTPVMNSLLDLWALVQFVDRSLIPQSRAQFTAAAASVTRGNERDACDGERERAHQIMDAVTEAVGKVTLRRTKDDVFGGTDNAAEEQQQPSSSSAVLPGAAASVAAPSSMPLGLPKEKTEVVVWVKLSAEQRRLYDGFLASDEVAAAMGTQQQQQQQPAGRRRGGDSEMLVLLSALKKICDHPFLNLTRDNAARALRAPFASMEGALSAFGTCLSSGKVHVCLRLVEAHMKEGRKTVIFSSSRVVLSILATVFAHKLPDAKVAMFTGDVPVAERAPLIRRWNTDPNLHVFLATTQVGGVGVTLTGASRAIIYDPSWNPAVDAQAVDRVHRIGQRSDVVVHRLVTCGTVEEKMYRRQVAKAIVARAAIGRQQPNGTPRRPASNNATKNKDGVRYFTRSQLRDLFVYDPAELDECATARIVRRVHGVTLGDAVYTDVCLVKDSAESDDVVAALGDHQALFQGTAESAEVLEKELRAEDEQAMENAGRLRRAGFAAADSHEFSSRKQRRRRGYSPVRPLDDADITAALSHPPSPFAALSQQDASQQDVLMAPRAGAHRAAVAHAAMDQLMKATSASPDEQRPPRFTGEGRDEAVAAIRSARASAVLEQEPRSTKDDVDDTDAPPRQRAVRAVALPRKSCAVALFQSQVDQDEYEAEAIAEAQRDFGAEIVDESALLYGAVLEDDDDDDGSDAAIGVYDDDDSADEESLDDAAAVRLLAPGPRDSIGHLVDPATPVKIQSTLLRRIPRRTLVDPFAASPAVSDPYGAGTDYNATAADDDDVRGMSCPDGAGPRLSTCLDEVPVNLSPAGSPQRPIPRQQRDSSECRGRTATALLARAGSPDGLSDDENAALLRSSSRQQ